MPRPIRQASTKKKPGRKRARSISSGFWITRNNDSWLGYELWLVEPTLGKDLWGEPEWQVNGDSCSIDDFCVDDFENATGLRLKPLQKVRVRLTLLSKVKTMLPRQRKAR